MVILHKVKAEQGKEEFVLTKLFGLKAIPKIK
jgi:hypothetical protein